MVELYYLMLLFVFENLHVPRSKLPISEYGREPTGSRVLSGAFRPFPYRKMTGTRRKKHGSGKQYSDPEAIVLETVYSKHFPQPENNQIDSVSCRKK
jgi:hypothetical protein